MDYNRQIIESIQRITGVKNQFIKVVSGSVLSVDKDEKTCRVLVEQDESEIEMPNVRLSSVANDGFTCYPAVESMVLIAVSDFMQPFVLMMSDLESIEATIGQMQLLMDEDGFTFNDGMLDGLVKVNSLVTKLNNLENKVNTIITTFNAHVHAETGGTTSPTATPVSGTLTPTVKSDIENDKIKQ